MKADTSNSSKELPHSRVLDDWPEKSKGHDADAGAGCRMMEMGDYASAAAGLDYGARIASHEDAEARTRVRQSVRQTEPSTASPVPLLLSSAALSTNQRRQQQQQQKKKKKTRRRRRRSTGTL